MDLPSHVIWSYALFHSQQWAAVAVVFCVLPDLLWFLPRLATFALHRGKIQFADANDLRTRHLYRTNHSLLTAALATAIVYFIFGQQIATGVAAGWLLHIFMDIWTHKGGIVDGIRIFYPVSDWKFPAPIYWREEVGKRPWLYLINILLASIAYFVAM